MVFKISDFSRSKGLVFCNKPKDAKNNAELLYLNDARKLEIDAVLFRRFFHNEEDKIPFNSEPSVCILNRDDNFFNSNKHIELHAKLWSAGKNEIYIIEGNTRIDIINARKPAVVYEVDKQKKQTLEPLRLANGAIKAFDFSHYSSYLFETGTFWEQDKFTNDVDEQTNSYVYLLNHLMRVRKRLFADRNLNLQHGTIDKLLITCILIKFLEEIKDDNERNTLKDIYKKNRVKDFADAINKNKCLDILTALALEFNGRIFDKFSPEEKNKIQSSNLSLIAHFLRANIDLDSGQLFLWEQYNFNYLPAEVISSIYENFIQAEATRQNGESEKGVVYTPIHLVNMLIDEVMPLNKPKLFENESFRVLDPACGSGVFLVAAYKRLLQWSALNNIKDGIIEYPNSKKAKKILEDNIFGVDVKHTATLVSVFGLTTAFLDKLSPQEIWNKLKFSDLNEKNIQENNFFDWALTAKNEGWDFDLIIGNPPFNIETGKKKSDVLKPTVLSQLNFKHKDIPNNNFALYFFEGAMLFAKKVCLIIPSNVLLYNRAAQEYRKNLFTNYNVRKIYDFTHLREALFTKKTQRNLGNQRKSGRTPVVAIIVENMPTERNVVEHTIIKRTITSEKKLRFEIDYYDRYYVNWNWAIDDTKSFIWKTNLLGGGRLFHLVYRLSLLRTLKAYLKDKKRNNDWAYNNGYISQFGTLAQNEQAPFLNNKLRIKPKTFDEFGNFKVEVIPQTEYFWNKRSKELFQPPHIIFKLTVEESTIPMAFVDEYLCFNSSFVGISAPDKDRTELIEIYNRLHKDEKLSKLYRAYILCTSAKAVIYHETSIVKDDIDALPYPENKEYLQPSQSENIIIEDVLKYYRHLGKAITDGSAGSNIFQQVNKPQLEKFGNVFCDTLNAIYSKDNKSWQSGIIQQTSSYTIYQFGFGKNDGLQTGYNKNFNQEVETLIEDKISNTGIVYKKIIRFYSSIDGYDCVFLIKPNTIRYWLNSIALRDADDTFIDLNKAGF